MVDVLIIGAGVTGCSIARELSRDDRKIVVVDRCSDICEGTSKANSGICHAGYDAKPGTLKAKLNVLGNQKMEELSKELDFPFKRNGSMVLCFDEKTKDKLNILYDQGILNGVKDLQILSKEEVLEKEPNLSDNIVADLYAQTGGIVCPFNLTIALAENAAMNGVTFQLNTEVKNIYKKENHYVVETNQGTIESKLVVNAAGVYADVFHNMVSKDKIKIIARRGEYCLFDKNTGNAVTSTIFQLPSELGKGVLVTPTVHGNLLIGPNAHYIDDKEGINTTSEGLDEIIRMARLSMPEIPMREVITSFAGLRAHEEKKDFVIGEVSDSKGFIDVAGIESPGLSCAPAIGEYVAHIIQDIEPAKKKENFISTRKGIVNMSLASDEIKKQMIKKDSRYANIICRCEMVSEGEIVDAIHRPLGATTLDGIKRRTRAGMGRCQAGFCSPKTVEILARELHKDEAEITKKGEGSNFIVGYDKEAL